MKFKEGDKVIIIEHPTDEAYENEFGKKFTISRINKNFPKNSDYPYMITDSYHGVYADKHLKHARVRYTKLAEKMYPDGKKEGEWWML